MAEKNLSYLTRWQLAVRDAEGYARGEVTVRRDDDPRLTPTEVAVAFVMSTYANSRDGRNVRPGAAAIARGAGVALPTAKAVRARLVAAGWLAVVHRGGSIEHGRREPSEYRLTIPTGSPPLPVTDDDRSSREHRPVAQDSPTGSPRLPNPVENLSNELGQVGRCRFCGEPRTFVEQRDAVDCLACHPLELSERAEEDRRHDPEQIEQNVAGVDLVRSALGREGGS